MSDNREQNRNENRMPSFSQTADTDFSYSDLDNIVERESSFNTPVVRQSQQGQQNTQGNQSQDGNVPVRKQEDPFERDMKAVLNESTEGIDENLKALPTQEQNTNQRDNEYQSALTTQGQGEDPYVAAFEIIKDLDIVRLPEGFDVNSITAEQLITLKEDTLNMQRQEAYDYMRGEVSHDPYMLELLDYSYQGGRFADLPKMIDLLQKDIDWRVIDLSDEKMQREVVKRYYADGLNPNVEKDAKLLGFIPSRIDGLAKEKKLRDESEVARKYYLDRIEVSKQAEYQRVMQDRARQEQEDVRIAQEQEAWDNSFRNSLATRNWSEEKKESIKKEMAHIRMQDGSSMPMWEYKQRMIFNDPSLFQKFLELTAGFDTKNKTFGESKEDDKLSTSAVNKLVERLNKKGQDTITGNANTMRQNPNQGVSRTVNPNSEWF